jgi:phospholipid/cholesterol/gamma-HCH transport system permease protein
LTLSELGQRQGWQLDDSRLPPNLQRLLRLAGDAALAPSTRGPEPSRRLFSRIGVATLRHAQGVNAGTTLLGETVLALGRLLRGRAVWYKADAWALLQTCGADALPIVSLVNALVGAIIAFVGSIQLQQFGAGILLADGVTIATVREMAAVITAVVLAGRTGAAFAAHIATMQGNEEIDALKVMGVPPVEFLVLPRVLALTMMMPLLYFYACVMGILGGLIVGTGMMDLSAITYFDRSLDALSTQSIVLAVLKSLAFGALIALCSCYYGLRAGRNAAAVGEATTSAVVAGIVGVISLDAVFDVCAHALGI